MSSVEVFVSVFGVFLGYWVISALVGNSSKHQPTSRPDAPPPNPPSEPSEYPEQFRPLMWFEILGVAKNASLEEVQTAYRSLIRQYHPDKVATLGDEIKTLADKKSKEINQAYNDALKVVGSQQ